MPGPAWTAWRTHSRFRRVPPETNPSRSASAAPSTSGTAARSRIIPTPDARPILYRWPSRPKPVTSVAALAPASSAAFEASRFRVVITSIAAAETSPVDFMRLFSRPTPSGLVSVIGRPASAASLRSRRSGRAVPVTAMPYLGSGSSTECPPMTGTPASVAIARPPASTSCSSS